MTVLELIGAGAVAAGGRAGRAALGVAPQQEGDAAVSADALKTFVAGFKRRTQQRYIDAAAELGIKALSDAVDASGFDQQAIDRAPFRFGILVATRLGPVSTRQQFLGSYAQRGGKSASATLFTNCGYNIVGAMLARSRNIRGPVLTFDAAGDGENWTQRLLGTARRLLAAGRADALFVGRAEAEEAVIVGLAAAAGIGGSGNARVPLAADGIARGGDGLRDIARLWWDRSGGTAAVRTAAGADAA